MSMTPTSNPNNVLWRLDRLEEDVRALNAGKPEVIAERVGMLSLRVTELRTEIETDMSALRDQIKDFRRIFVGVCSGLGVAIAVAVVAQVLTGGTP